MRATELLLRMLSPDGGHHLAHCPASAWSSVIAVAERERVLSALGSVAVRSGLARPVPESMARFLEGRGRPTAPMELIALAHSLNQIRTQDLTSQLTRTLAQLADAGIPAAPLKGAAILRDGLWPDVAGREMTDLDILVLDRSQAEQAQQVLIDAGYREPASHEYEVHHVLPDAHQLIPLRHPGHAGSIEIHRSLLPDEWEWIQPTPEVVERVVHTADGFRLDQVDLARHIISHACLNDRALQRFDLATRATLDIGFLCVSNPDLASKLRDTEMSVLERQAVERVLAGAERIWAAQHQSPRSARASWTVSVVLSDVPTLHAVISHAMLLPVFLDRERLSARAGHPLRGLELQTFRAKATTRRIREAIGQIRSGTTRIA